MKPRKPILRKTPLKRSTKPISRKTPLERSTAEIKRTAIRKTSRPESIQSEINKATKVFNAFIRKRDQYDDFTFICISCDTCYDISKMQCGHYISSTNSILRFNELNNNGECESCNCHDTYHLIGYRKNLIQKIGIEKVEWLESHATGQEFKWDRELLKEITTKYK